MPPDERYAACSVERRQTGRQRHRCAHHAAQRLSRHQKRRKRIEECFGWLKDIALLRKLQHRGILKVSWIFTFAAAAYTYRGRLLRTRKNDSKQENQQLNTKVFQHTANLETCRYPMAAGVRPD
jgi:hypothetical protein